MMWRLAVVLHVPLQHNLAAVHLAHFRALSDPTHRTNRLLRLELLMPKHFC